MGLLFSDCDVTHNRSICGFFLWLFFNVVWANWALLEAQICLKKNKENLNG